MIAVALNVKNGLELQNETLAIVTGIFLSLIFIYYLSIGVRVSLSKPSDKKAVMLNKLNNRVYFELFFMLLLMTVSFFTISKNLAITQGFKAGVRTIVLFWAWFELILLKRKGFITGVEYENREALWFYLLYLLLGFASFMWSSKVSFSILQWLMVVQSLVTAYFIMRLFVVYNHYFVFKPIRLTQLFSYVVFIIAVVLLVGAVVAPDVFFRSMRGGEEKRLGGYLMNPNELGMLSSLGAAVSFLELSKTRNKAMVIVMLLVIVAALALTTSRSSFIGFIAVVGIIVNKTASKNVKIAIYLIIALSIPFILQYVIFKAGNVDEVLSMTGRLPFWTALLHEAIVKEPWFGFGFQRIYYTDRFQGLNTYAGMMTHNAFLQILLNLGFVGFFIGLTQIFFIFRAFLKDKSEDVRNLFIAFIIPLFVNSFTEFGIFGNANYAIFFYQVLIFIAVLRPKKHFSLREKLRDRKTRDLYGLPPVF